MLISEYEPVIGQEVGFAMSYPEVLTKEPNAHYVKAIEASIALKEKVALEKQQQEEA